MSGKNFLWLSHRHCLPPSSNLQAASKSWNQRGGLVLPSQTKPAPRHKTSRAGGLLKREFDRFEALRIAAVIAILAICVMMLVGLFAPGLRYSLVSPIAVPIDSLAFLNEVEALVNSKI